MSQTTLNVPACYGGMFPDLNRLHLNTPCKGAVFSSLATSQGIGVQSLNVQVART